MRLTGATSPKITTPPVPLAAGELVEITGWVKVRSDGGGGAKVSDTLGGDELALRIGATDDYELFRLIRSASSDATFRIRFETYGEATIDLDGVMVRPVALPSSVATRGAGQAK